MNVKIIGIGGCGRNILNRLIDIGFDPDMVVYMDTAPGTLATMFDNTDKLVAEKIKELLGESRRWFKNEKAYESSPSPV